MRLKILLSAESPAQSSSHRRDYIFGEKLSSLFVHSPCVEVCAGDYYSGIEGRKAKHFVASISTHEECRIRTVSHFERLQPPEVAVFLVITNVGMGLGRLRYPIL